MDLYVDAINRVKQAEKESRLCKEPVQIMAVSKGQSEEKIAKLIGKGHQVFGENRVQEAKDKWLDIKKNYPQREIQLHMIGSLQSNKVGDVVQLFDAIHSLDREKIAYRLAKEMEIQRKTLFCYIQVNIGEENQKGGIYPNQVKQFTEYCINDLGLDVRGYMCVPPSDEPPAPYFALMYKLAQENQLSGLSMGMSQDFETAIRMGSNCVRIGTSLFGERDI